VLFSRSLTVSAFNLSPIKVCKIISPYGKSLSDSTILFGTFCTLEKNRFTFF
jgi:hypothetical protein